MVIRRKPPVTKSFDDAMRKYPHLAKYVRRITREMGEPEWFTKLDRDLKKLEFPNLIYPVGDPLFIHIYRKAGEPRIYHVIEPEIDTKLKKLNDKILDKMIAISNKYPVPDKIEDMEPILVKLFEEIVEVDTKKSGSKFMSAKIKISKWDYDMIKYYLIRDRVGYGKLEPLFLDPYIEDIHCVGVGSISLVHKVFEMLRTNVVFSDDFELNKYMVETSERVERPVSDARSVVDAMMPDGSRVNFIYGREVSLEGSSFTVRKFSEVPVSITQIISWNTMDAELAAYVWLCLEHGMNMFVCGETASGKTTTLNACSAFISPDAKVYTVENTPEVTMPHDAWQHLITREAGQETDVTMFHLLIAALRSRPNYIIVGEIRGEEGNIAFQAMQCIREGYIFDKNKGVLDIKQLYNKCSKKYGSKNEKGDSFVSIPEKFSNIFVSEKDGKILNSNISKIYKMRKQKLIKIEIDNGEIIEVTPSHRFIIENNREINADKLLTKDHSKINILFPKKLPWQKKDLKVFELLDNINISKTTEYKKIELLFKKTKDYKKISEQYKDYFKTRSNTIPFKIFKKIYDYFNKKLPNSVDIVFKGKKEYITIHDNISDSLLISIADYIADKPVSNKKKIVLERVFKFNKSKLGKNFFRFSKKQLIVIFSQLKDMSKIDKIYIPDKLWYCLGRLVGDDSLYMTKSKTGKFKDFRWQIKNKSKDEGIIYARDAKKLIPNSANRISTTFKSGVYSTRICKVDYSFVDFLIKNKFISLNDKVTYSKAVNKNIPFEKIGNLYAYVAGMMDSDFTIRYSKNRSFEIKFALNTNRDYPQLMQDQLRFVKKFEHGLFPKILCVEFRYNKKYKKQVMKFRQFCIKLGLKVRIKEYNKANGIGGRVEFSSNQDQKVFSTWKKKVSKYMYRKDKINAIKAMKNTSQMNIYKTKRIYYQKYSLKINKPLLPELSIAAKILGYSLISDNIRQKEKSFLTFQKRNIFNFIRVESSVTDHSYDICMKNGLYYLGGNHNLGYIFDTGHPVCSTFHAGSVRSMIQRLTGHPINVPIASIDNLNIVLIQQVVEQHGHFVRRVLSLTEIERFYDVDNKMITRQVFNWDPARDQHRFRGLYNSYILEKKVALMLGYEDTREIYKDLDLRKRILEKMVENKIFNYFDVWNVISKYHTEGVKSLPFTL